MSPIASSEAPQTPRTWCKTPGCADNAAIAARCGTPSRCSPPPRLDSRSTSPNRPEHDASSKLHIDTWLPEPVDIEADLAHSSERAEALDRRCSCSSRTCLPWNEPPTCSAKRSTPNRLPPAFHDQARRPDDHERALLARLAGLPPLEPRPGSFWNAQPKLDGDRKREAAHPALLDRQGTLIDEVACALHDAQASGTTQD